jgi:DNA-binding response OmpR family regulator
MTTGIEERLILIPNPPSILVVDDDRYMCDLLQIHLAKAGYSVAAAQDAIVARRLLLESAPDLLIIGVQMPYRNGLDFVTTLLTDRTVPRVRVVFVSSNEQFASTAHVLGAGFLLKPFHKDELLDTVSRTLAGKPDANTASSAFSHDELPGLSPEAA